MKLTAAIFSSSGVFLLVCAMMFFVKASKQAGQQAALNLIGPGLALVLIAIIAIMAGISFWKKS